jgi:hypothetical protein
MLMGGSFDGGWILRTVGLAVSREFLVVTFDQLRHRVFLAIANFPPS